MRRIRLPAPRQYAALVVQNDHAAVAERRVKFAAKRQNAFVVAAYVIDGTESGRALGQRQRMGGVLVVDHVAGNGDHIGPLGLYQPQQPALAAAVPVVVQIGYLYDAEPPEPFGEFHLVPHHAHRVALVPEVEQHERNERESGDENDGQFCVIGHSGSGYAPGGRHTCRVRRRAVC